MPRPVALVLGSIALFSAACLAKREESAVNLRNPAMP